MYLKNLTVLGFKSFADKTTLNFQPGVTAIVGPNGCGKSNVSDAIRWVLGEQSAKALRGGEMADVIFNGTDGRKPLGMAEVSLTIGGVDDEHLTAAGVEIAYNEVTVTRRVFRDGGSEYFINKTPCRLRDIQQLFMGTGVGRTSYSIMAQGNITQILSSKPEDRRMIFEEAAGITKYKAQKKESLRKLEYTEQNLLRVADLVREVKRQIGSLQRQAGKARRYKQISADLQHLETQHARHQFDVLHAEIREREVAAEQLRTDIESCAAEVLRREDEISELRQRMSELEHTITGMQQRGLELKAEVERHESRIHFNQERVREVSAQDERALGEIAQSEERIQIARQETAVLQEKIETSDASLAAFREAVSSKLAALQSIEEQLRGLQEALRQAQSSAFSAAQDLNRARNEVTALDLQKQGNVVRLEKLSAEKIQLEEERVRLELRLAEFATDVESQKLGVQMRRGTVEERQKRLREIQEELNRAGQEQDGVLRQQAEKRSRLNVLEQLEAGHEGFSAGAVAALRQSQGVLGSLADKIRVPDQYITAIETALGHHLQVVLTGETRDARAILNDLQTNRKGRASVAPMQFVGAADETEAAGNWVAPELNGVPLEAVAAVQCEPAVRPLIQRLLGQTRLVRDLDAATLAWSEAGGTHDYVTLGGDLLSRHGVYTGGAQAAAGHGQAPGSILGRKNQILELQTALGQLQEQVADMSRRKGQLQSEQTELQAGLQEAQTELRACEVAVATHEGEVRALQNSERLLHQKIDTVVYEIGSLAAQEQEGLERRATLAAHADGLEIREQEHQARVADLTDQLEHLRQQRDAGHAILTESKVALAAEEQLRSSLVHQHHSLEQRVRESSHVVEQRRSELSSFAARKQAAEVEIQQSQTRIDTLQHDREQVNAQVAELAAQKQERETDLVSREEALREQRRVLAGRQQSRGALEVELAQKNMGVQNLRERVQQKYHLNLDDIHGECITIIFADEGPAKVHVMTPDEMAASGVATDWEGVARQVDTLQQRLDEMGPVNLVAIEEYEETEQRYQFLSKQHDDLAQAKTQLLEVINRINVQTKDMFRETFRAHPRQLPRLVHRGLRRWQSRPRAHG